MFAAGLVRAHLDWNGKFRFFNSEKYFYIYVLAPKLMQMITKHIFWSVITVLLFVPSELDSVKVSFYAELVGVVTLVYGRFPESHFPGKTIPG